MKKFKVTLVALAIFGFVNAQQKNHWKEHTGTEKIITHKSTERSSFAKDFKVFDLDITLFKQELSTNIDDKSTSLSNTITLPNADGGMEDFELVEASNFEPALQALYPEIRAYSGKGITDKSATLKLSISPEGVQTMVFRADKEIEFIEPYSDDKKVYAAFKSQRKNGQLPWNCSTTEKQMVSSINDQVLNMNLVSRSGGNLKTMRLAQSCNAEYSNYFGATSSAQVALVLAAFNNTLTRCNGIYEKDLALHLNLVAASTNVIYYNPATDPYTTLASWNTQLESTLVSVIGEANYDIGHMFGSSGGGGNAGCIGCICVNRSGTINGKGSGITSPSDGIPQGDNFDIDYVAHEIGHQLGANHTFSMNNEGLGVNKEVGSGITIMGYAGITAQDVAPHSIDIFHEASIAQIQANLLTKTCPTTLSIAGNNSTPVVATVPNYTIPRSTPFALTGSATDIDGNQLTYCWEQNDNSSTIGAGSVASETKITGPNWISFRPTTSPTRIFPRLSTILAGSLITGTLGGDAGANVEALSSVARTLNFRLTVRDNAPYSSTLPSVGQTAFTDMVVTVNGTAGPFEVSAPNTAVSWATGSTQTITWSVNSTNLAPINCTNVKISLSTDGGQTFPTVLAASTPNDGSEALVIPASQSTTARIKIEAVGNIFFDISNSNFSITGPSLCGDPAGLTSSSVTNNGAAISWNAVTNATSYAIDYKTAAAATWTTLTASQAATTATLSGLTAATAYNWRVSATCPAGTGNTVQANFTTLTNCGDATGLITSSVTNIGAAISWNAVTNATSYAIDYKTAASATWTTLTASQAATTATLSGLTAATAYNWRVSATCPTGTGNTVQANFTTLANCGNATGLTSSAIGSNTATISWSAVTNVTSYTVEYKLNAATIWTPVTLSTATSRTANLTGLTQLSVYNWRVRANCATGSGNFVTANFTTTTASCISIYENSLNGTTAGAAVIPFNTDIKGLISPAADQDNYKFTITTRGTITLTLTTLPANYALRLISSTGAVLATSNRGGTTNETINYTAAPGIYYARVYGSSATVNNASTCYTLRVALGTALRTADIITSSFNNQSTGTDLSETSKQVTLYPNPVQNTLNVNLSGLTGTSEIVIYNMNGTRVMSKSTGTANTEIDLSKLQGGVYMVNIFNGNSVVSRSKIVKL